MFATGLRFVLTLMLLVPAVHADDAGMRAQELAQERAQERAQELAEKGVSARLAGQDEEAKRLILEALRADRECDLARGHANYVRHNDQWSSLTDAEQRTSQDMARQAYVTRRDAAIGRVGEELALAQWCKTQQLEELALLHGIRVIQSRKAPAAARQQARQLLGLQRMGNRWLTPHEYATTKQHFANQSAAMQSWLATCEQWREAIVSGRAKARFHAFAQLRALDDEAAIPALDHCFQNVPSSAGSAIVACFARIDTPPSTAALVRRAARSPHAAVRSAAVAALQQRPLHDYLPLVLAEMDAPYQSAFRVQVGWDGLVRHEHHLFREGGSANHAVSSAFVGGPLLVPTREIKIQGARQPGRTGEAARNQIALVERYQAQQLRRAAVVRELIAYREVQRARQLEGHVAVTNERIRKQNQHVFAVLRALTGGGVEATTPTDWYDWWYDYNEMYREPKPTYYQRYGHADPEYIPWTEYRTISCFPAGTPVRTETGLRPIESIQPGDRVLAQDVDTGSLSYQLVERTTIRPASPLREITVDGQTVSTTLGHPFWVNDTGWTMAKLVNVGDCLHTLAGPRRVTSVAPAAPAKAYNLVVSGAANYFVGDLGALVHDNTYRRPTRMRTPGLRRTATLRDRP